MDRKSTSESLEVLRSDKKIDGSPSATNIDILDKYESAIRNEIGGMTTDIRRTDFSAENEHVAVDFLP